MVKNPHFPLQGPWIPSLVRKLGSSGKEGEREGGQSRYRPKHRGGITRGSGRQFPYKLGAVWDESLGSCNCRVGREACQRLRFKRKGRGVDGVEKET